MFKFSAACKDKEALPQRKLITSPVQPLRQKDCHLHRRDVESNTAAGQVDTSRQLSSTPNGTLRHLVPSAMPLEGPAGSGMSTEQGFDRGGDRTGAVLGDGEVSMAELDACLAAGSASIEVLVPVAAAPAGAAAPCSAAAAAVVLEAQAGLDATARSRGVAAIARASPTWSRDGSRVRCQSPSALCMAVQSAQKQKRPAPMLAGSPSASARCAAVAAAAQGALRTPTNGRVAAAAAGTPGSAKVRLQLPEACPVQSIRAAPAAAAASEQVGRIGSTPCTARQGSAQTATAAKTKAVPLSAIAHAATAEAGTAAPARGITADVDMAEAVAPLVSAHAEPHATPGIGHATPAAAGAACAGTTAPPSTASMTVAQLAAAAAATRTEVPPESSRQPAKAQQDQQGQRGQRPKSERAAAKPSTTAAADGAAADEDVAAAGAVQLSAGDDGDQGAASPPGEVQQQPLGRLGPAVVTGEQAELAAAASKGTEQRRTKAKGRRGSRIAGGKGRRSSAAAPTDTTTAGDIDEGKLGIAGRAGSVTPLPTIRVAHNPSMVGDSGDESSPDVPIGKLAATAATTAITSLPAVAPAAAPAPERDAQRATQAAAAPPPPPAPASTAVTPAGPRRAAAARAAAAIAALAVASRTPVYSQDKQDSEASPGTSAESSPDVPIGRLAAAAAVAATTAPAAAELAAGALPRPTDSRAASARPSGGVAYGTAAHAYASPAPAGRGSIAGADGGNAAASDLMQHAGAGSSIAREATEAAASERPARSVAADEAGANRLGAKRKRQSPEPLASPPEAQSHEPVTMAAAEEPAERGPAERAQGIQAPEPCMAVTVEDRQLPAHSEPPHLVPVNGGSSELGTASGTALSAEPACPPSTMATSAPAAAPSATLPGAGASRVQLGALWKRQRTSLLPVSTSAPRQRPAGSKLPGGHGQTGAAAQRHVEPPQQHPLPRNQAAVEGSTESWSQVLDDAGALGDCKREAAMELGRMGAEAGKAYAQQDCSAPQQQDQQQQGQGQQQEQQDSKQQQQQMEQEEPSQQQDQDARMQDLPVHGGAKSSAGAEGGDTDDPHGISQPDEQPSQPQNDPTMQPPQQQQPRAHIRSIWKRPCIATPPPAAAMRAAGPGRRAALLSRAGQAAATTATPAAPVAEPASGSQPELAAADRMELGNCDSEAAAVDVECEVRLRDKHRPLAASACEGRALSGRGTGGPSSWAAPCSMEVDMDEANNPPTATTSNAATAAPAGSCAPMPAAHSDAKGDAALHCTPPRPRPGRRTQAAGPSSTDSPMASLGASLLGPSGVPLGKPPRSPGDARVSLSPSPRACPSPSPGPPGGSGLRMRDPSVHPSVLAGAAGAAAGIRPSSASPSPPPKLQFGSASRGKAALQPRSPLSELGAGASDGGGGKGLAFLAQPLAPIRTKMESATAPAASLAAPVGVAPGVVTAGYGVQPSIIRAVDALLAIPLVSVDDESPVGDEGRGGVEVAVEAKAAAQCNVMGCNDKADGAAAASAPDSKAAAAEAPEKKAEVRGSLDKLLEAVAHGSLPESKTGAAPPQSPLALSTGITAAHGSAGQPADADTDPHSGPRSPPPQQQQGVVAGSVQAAQTGAAGSSSDPPSGGPKPFRSALRGVQPFFSSSGNWASSKVDNSSLLVCEERLDGGGTPSRRPAEQSGQGKAVSPLPPKPRPASKAAVDARTSPLGVKQAARSALSPARGQLDSPLAASQRTPDGYSTPPCAYAKSRPLHGAPASGGGLSAWPRSVSYPGHQYDMMIQDVVQQMLDETSPDPLPPLTLGPTAPVAAATTGLAAAADAPAAATAASAAAGHRDGASGAASNGTSSTDGPAASGSKSQAGGDNEPLGGNGAAHQLPYHHGHAELSPSRVVPPPRRRSIYLPSPSQPQLLKRRRFEELEEPDAAVMSEAAPGDVTVAGSEAGGAQQPHEVAAPGQEHSAAAQQHRRRPRKAARVEGGSGTVAAAPPPSDCMDLEEAEGLGDEESEDSDDEMIVSYAISAAEGRAGGGGAAGSAAVSAAAVRAGGMREAGMRGVGPAAQQAPSVFCGGRALPYNAPGGGNWMKPGLAWGRATSALPGAHPSGGPARSSPQLRPAVAGPSRPSPTATGPLGQGARLAGVSPGHAAPAALAARGGAGGSGSAASGTADPGSPGDALIDVPRVTGMPRGASSSKRQNSYLGSASLEAAHARPTLEQVYREALINARLAQAWAEGERWARCDLAGLPADLSKRGVTERLAMLEAATANLNCYRGAEGAAKIISRIEGEWEHLKRIRTAAAARTSGRTPSGASPSPALFAAGAATRAAGGPPHTPLPFADLTLAAAAGAAAAADRRAAAAGPPPQPAAAASKESGSAGAGVEAGEARPSAAGAGKQAAESSGHVQCSYREVTPPPGEAMQPPHQTHADARPSALPPQRQQEEGAQEGAADVTPPPKAGAATSAEGFGTPLPRVHSGGPAAPDNTTPPVAAPASQQPARLSQQQQLQLTPPASILKAVPTPQAMRGLAAGVFGTPAVAVALTPGCGGSAATGGRKAVKFSAVLELGPQSGYRPAAAPGGQQRQQQQPPPVFSLPQPQ